MIQFPSSNMPQKIAPIKSQTLAMINYEVDRLLFVILIELSPTNSCAQLELITVPQVFADILVSL